MMSIALSEEKIKEALVNLPDWTFTNDKIKREYIFRNFVEAVGFIVEIAFVCEKSNHHPELLNVYSRVQIELTTHDAGNKISEKDLDLAKLIEEIAKKRI